MFLLKNLLIGRNFMKFPLYVSLFSCRLKKIVTNFCHLNYYLSWCGLPWIDFVEGSLCLLDLHI